MSIPIGISVHFQFEAICLRFCEKSQYPPFDHHLVSNSTRGQLYSFALDIVNC